MPNPKRPTDFNQRALQVVMEATGQEPKLVPEESILRLLLPSATVDTKGRMGEAVVSRPT